jgi:hypothetical protein
MLANTYGASVADALVVVITEGWRAIQNRTLM